MLSTPPVIINDTIKGIKFDKKISHQIEIKDKKYNIKISNNEKIIFFEIDEINNFETRLQYTFKFRRALQN